MSDIAVKYLAVQAMSSQQVEQVRSLEEELKKLDQVELATHHVLHGGVYSRTIVIPAGVAITGALVKVPTTLIINGHVTVHLGGQTTHLDGYHVLPASAGRKQAFYAFADTSLTMIFATGASSIGEAEDEFTDESDQLISRQLSATNITIITGE